MIQKITNNDLSDALKQPTAVLDFSAKWCGPCKMLAPVLENVADAMQGTASFYSIDVDENMDLAMQYRVSSIPCIVILKNGKEFNIAYLKGPSLISLLRDEVSTFTSAPFKTGRTTPRCA